MRNAAKNLGEKAAIVLSLRRMIWTAVCRDREPEGQLVGVSITNHPNWREHITRLSTLAGVSDDDCASVQGVLPWEKFKSVFRDVPELLEPMKQALTDSSPRLTVCTIFISGHTYEIVYLGPLAPKTLN